MIYKFGLILVPPVAMVIYSILGEVCLKHIENLNARSSILAVTGVVGGYLLIIVIKFFSIKVGVSFARFGNWKTLFAGCALGLTLSLFSGYLFQITQKPQTDLSRITENLAPRFIGNTSPAIVEEVTFRGGVVHSVTALWGKGFGLASGSVPFGLIHLVGRLLGKPIGPWHVLGVMAAGLLLSVAYLKFGLLFSIGVHWFWNSLCGMWVTVFGLPRNGGVQMVEGAWTTVLILVAFTVVLFYFPRGNAE